MPYLQTNPIGYNDVDSTHNILRTISPHYLVTSWNISLKYILEIYLGNISWKYIYIYISWKYIFYRYILFPVRYTSNPYIYSNPSFHFLFHYLGAKKSMELPLVIIHFYPLKFPYVQYHKKISHQESLLMMIKNYIKLYVRLIPNFSTSTSSKLHLATTPMAPMPPLDPRRHTHHLGRRQHGNLHTSRLRHRLHQRARWDLSSMVTGLTWWSPTQKNLWKSLKMAIREFTRGWCENEILRNWSKNYAYRWILRTLVVIDLLSFLLGFASHRLQNRINWGIWPAKTRENLSICERGSRISADWGAKFNQNQVAHMMWHIWQSE